MESEVNNISYGFPTTMCYTSSLSYFCIWHKKKKIMQENQFWFSKKKTKPQKFHLSGGKHSTDFLLEEEEKK